jgi:hypothetical protein
MRTCRDERIGDLTYPVARMRSTTSRTLRRCALWVGSDRPTPRGSGEGDGVTIDDGSGVVVKEVTEEMEVVLLLWGFGDI